ncbi:von Willebrand factor A domain-containing protein 7-like [Aplochiton taeniatus]
MTETALLNTTLQVCRDLTRSEGRDFTAPIKSRNAWVDISHYFDADYHFTDERFVESRKVITDGLSVVKANVKISNFDAARDTLGVILHPLQDFYSHSNWVEIGNKVPNPNIIRRDTSIGKTADRGRPTCRNCVGKDCRNNILEDILREHILTTSYFGYEPLFSGKPAGKCSHGGPFDFSSRAAPTGGINKDTLDAEHGFLHRQAAAVAVAATTELLVDIRGAAGDADFLRLMGISRASKALCFVIDTTGSMSDDIDAVKSFTTSLIDSRRGTQEEPSLYILVPFNDPDVGPLIRTTDSDFFKTQINTLGATGGQDTAEFNFSGLQLALTGSPPRSDIFLFTNAPANDTYLLGTVNLFQTVGSPGMADCCSFSVDQSVTNLTVYITGRSLSFTLTSPSGLSQSNLELNGSLGTIQTVGNFLTLRLNKEVGTWEIRMTSTQLYTLKVIGQSALDFLFDFVEVSEGSFQRQSSTSLRASSITLTADSNGVLRSVRLRQGNGTLNTSTVVGAHGYSLTLVSYSASCCSPDVELVAVDRVGNVGSCLAPSGRQKTP